MDLSERLGKIGHLVLLLALISAVLFIITGCSSSKSKTLYIDGIGYSDYGSVWTDKELCEDPYSAKKAQNSLMPPEGLEVKVTSGIPDDPEKCVRIVFQEGQNEGRYAYIPYEGLRKEEFE